MKRFTTRWRVAAAVLLVLGSVSAYQIVGWAAASRDLAERQRALDASRTDLSRLEAEQEAARQGARKELNAAAAAEQKVAAEYQAALDEARRTAEAKEFTVRLTGPARVQPGAPNKWQIETLRRGAVTRPKKMEVVVKDDRDAELLRQTHDRPVGAATLDLPASFWAKVKPNADLFLEVVAYTGDDAASALTERLPLARPVYVSHLATDKPLYQPGETVRFRSLTLDRASLKPPAHDQHLRFRLRDPADTATPVGEGNGRLLSDLRPVLGPDGKPLRGIGVGEHPLPADAPGGEYKLDLFEVDAATGKDVLIETRKFIVNRYTPDTFEKKLEFDGKSYGPGDVVQARVEVSRTAGGPLHDARATVIAAAGGRNIHQDGTAQFTVVPAAEAGRTKAVLDVRFKLPADLFDQSGKSPNATLAVTVRDGSDTETIVRPIPLVTKNLVVEFYPEGGDMVAGVPGRVYVWVRTPQGKPADLKGTITDGTTTVAEVATLTDAENPGVNRGHGVFTLAPREGVRYFLKVASPAGIVAPTPEGFPLPEIKPDGVALTSLDAVTAAGSPVRVRVQAGRGAKTLHVGAYARGRLIDHRRVEAAAGSSVDVSLTGDAAAGGVTRVTVFEELPTDGTQTALVPRAERLVYRHPGERLVLAATPDKARYAPGGTVRLGLSATDETGRAAPAVLLVGVVNRSVVTMADNKTDRLMPTHFLLSGEVKHPAELEHADFLLTDHPKAAAALDLLLGTQGWRRFVEQTTVAADPADRADVDKLLVAEGQRTAAPFELYKLERQRVDAEFRPRAEYAALKRAAAERDLAAPAAGNPELGAKLSTAQAAARFADSLRSQAAVEVERYQSRARYFAVLSVLVVALGIVLSGILLAIGLLIRWTATKPGGAFRPFIAGAATVAVCGILFLVMNMGTNPNSTFSFVGSAIKPPAAAGPWLAGRDGAGAEQAAMPRDMEEKASRPVPKSAPPAPPPPGAVLDPIGVPDGKAPDSGAILAQPEWTGSSVGDRAPKLRPSQAAPPPVAFGPGRKPGGATPQAGKKTSDRELVAAALKPRVVAEAAVDDPIVGRDRAPWKLQLSASAVPPCVVREYAHRRDPSLGEVRSDFTETVYWHPALVLPASGTATVEFQLSDDIARYQVLVAGHTPGGRIGAITTTIEARKPFSVDPKLPAEIAHTDTVDVPVRVTNDSDDPRAVALALAPTGLKLAGAPRSTFDLGPNGKNRLLARLTAGMLQGDAGLVVEGRSGPDTDTIARAVRVVPDGFPGVGSFSDTIERTARGRVTLPKDVVPGSLRVRLEVYPTSMADLVKGLEGLLREPSGCFEQTSTTNYPNTLILNYLNETNQANPEAARRAKQLLDRGYARLASFECPDTPQKVKHGFEWFGAADRQHEALTAYGLLQFKDMARVHQVDPELIRRTQAFLLSRRDGQGGFKQNPHSLHSWGGAKQVVNAYIVWALVESDPDDAERMDLAKEIAALKAEALDENSAGGKDAYFVALTANVLLIRGDREAAHRLLDRLQEKHTKGGAVTGATTSVVNSGGRDLQIETTALALLGWLRANDPKYAVTVKESTRWVSQQRGGYGGFGSTQSTILALKALTLHAKKSAHPAEAGELRLSVGGKVVASRRFTEKDVEVIGLDVPNAEAAFNLGGTSDVEIATDAKQAYPFALSYTYTTLTPISAEKCAVAIGTKLGRAAAVEGETVPLTVTFENRQDKAQGMAVAVVGLPAGMRVPTDLKQLTELREKERVSFFEVRGRELVLYWRELTPKQKIELTVDLVCDVPGAYRGPASRGYLYYDADHKHWVSPLSVTITPSTAR